MARPHTISGGQAVQAGLYPDADDHDSSESAFQSGDEWGDNDDLSCARTGRRKLDTIELRTPPAGEGFPHWSYPSLPPK